MDKGISIEINNYKELKSTIKTVYGVKVTLRKPTAITIHQLIALCEHLNIDHAVTSGQDLIDRELVNAEIERLKNGFPE